MTERRDHEAALRKMTRQSPDTLPLFAQIMVWNSSPGTHHADDREVMLSAFVFLEDSLKMLLRQQWGMLPNKQGSRLFDADGEREAILGSAYAKLLMCTELEFISPACNKDIKSIILIRNTFAHTGENLNFSHPSLQFLSQLECLRDLGPSREIHVDGKPLMTINLSTPRAKLLGFIMMFWFFCSLMRENNTPRVFWEIFAPSPLPSISPLQGLPSFEIDDHEHNILANLRRSSPL